MLTRFDLAYYLISPVAIPYFGYRAVRRGKYHDSARGMFGRNLPGPDVSRAFRDGSVWIHAVSVGEVVAARSVMPLLRQLFPEKPFVVTTITETGQAHARRNMPEADAVHYFPLDFSWNVRRFLDCFNPSVFIMMETELWPNFLTMAAARGTDIFMVNGKLSDKSFRGYRKGRGLLRPVFDSIRAFCMQTESDAERMRALCRRPNDVHVTGNCKFDVPAERLTAEAERAYRERYRLGESRPVIVVGSTHPGEEEIVLEAFRQVRRSVPNARMILSPRHPERFEAVWARCRRGEDDWSVSRATDPNVQSPDIFLLDKMGELADMYGLGDVAVVAGSFSDIGGHNVLEAAAHAVPVLVGPHMHAQKELDRLFGGDDSGCVRCEANAEDLARKLQRLLSDPEECKRLGARARETARANQGSARRSVEIIARVLGREQRMSEPTS